MELSLSPFEIAELVHAREVRGETADTIRGIAGLETARPGDLSFLGNRKYKPQVATTEASLVLLPLDYEGQPKANQSFLFLEKPSVGLALLCARIEKSLWLKPEPGIHPTALIAPDARVAASAAIGPFCVVESGAVIGERTRLDQHVVVGRNCEVGEDCWLMSGVKILVGCILKNRIRLQPGVIIGSDGFGYEFVGGRHERVPQVGWVVLEDDVDVGANTTIDRARFSQTIIGEGTKIDNQVQIGHNVIVGKYCIICAQVGISGSTTVEDYVIIGGQAGLAGHLTVGRESKIDGQTGVNSDLEPKSFVKGSPCLPYTLEQRVNVLKKRLPDLFHRVDALEEQIKKPSSAS